VNEAVFETWVREAEEKFSVAGDLPLIDDAQIDMWDETRHWAYRVVEEDIGSDSTAIGDAEEPAIEFLELRLIGSGNALPVRFVILNFLYRLAHFTGFSSESSAPLLHSIVWPHLERFVRLQEVSVLDDPRSLQWEVNHACVIQDWDRAMALIDRLKSLGAITEHECRALKGQVHVCSVVVPRNGGQDQGAGGLLYKDFPGWWVPKMDRKYGGRGPGSSLRPFALLYWGMNLTDDAEYSAGERERLSDAAHEWDVCFDDNSDLLGAYRAAWGKCHFLSGDYLRAAKQFDRLISGGCGLPSDYMELDDPRPGFYLNAAECFRKGGEAEAAIRHLEECAQKFPRTEGLWLKLAKLYLSSPLDLDIQKVQECLRKEEEIDPAFGDDPRTSIAFALAELGGTGLSGSLREFAESNPEICQVMDVLMSRHWAEFQSLDDDSRKQWVGAAAYLWGTSPLRSVLRRKVALMFPDIAESQLRTLFDCFRQEKGPTVLQGISSVSEKDKFVKFLKGSPLTLGEMIFEIEATRRLPEPVHPDLKSWLQRHARRLTQSWDPSRARRLNDLRCRCHGGEISEQEALELYDLSVWLVSQLAAS
jgi:hypothetical protein